MKNSIYTFFLFITLFTAKESAARELFKEQIIIENSSIKKDQGELMIRMDIILPENLYIESNRYALLTPVLKSENYNRLLPPVAVYGRKREIIAERTNSKPEENYQIIRRKNKTEQAVVYEVRIPFEQWMSGSGLYLIEDLCGCGNNLEENYEVYLAAMPQKYIPQPRTVTIVPEVEEIKTRYKESSSFIDYPVNQVTIYPDYRNNQQELAKIHETFDDQEMQEIRKITIHGFASPEGSYSNNKRLAQGRTETLKNYIRTKYSFPESIFSIGSTPENWEGFRRLVVESDIDQKQAILKIIDSSDAEDIKEAKLKQMGSVYTMILREWFPGLRRADYRVDYIVPDYDPETAARMAHERPQLVSILEMYQAALRKEKGSKEYNDLFEIAARTFPENPVVNTNAAAMEIERGNLDAAQKYMEKVKDLSGEAYNNLGCIALLKGEFDKAIRYFEQAKDAEVQVAEANLEEVRKKEENYNITGEL